VTGGNSEPRPSSIEARGVKKLDTLNGAAKSRDMDAAEQIESLETEALSWTEICARYPDQYVCLVDVTRPERLHPTILSARVVGHGTSHDAAFEPIRELDERYPRFAIRYTGVCTEPLIRPSFVLDDADLELLAEPLTRTSLSR